MATTGRKPDRSIYCLSISMAAWSLTTKATTTNGWIPTPCMPCPMMSPYPDIWITPSTRWDFGVPKHRKDSTSTTVSCWRVFLKAWSSEGLNLNFKTCNFRACSNEVNSSAVCINITVNCVHLVQGGDYIGAVLNRNNAENISRVLYPNDNVSLFHFASTMQCTRFLSIQLFRIFNITKNFG